ncbi:hypothetical protein [Deinococcus marmoris]|uniref:Uncharacterized protein n=1 Tax=Deinococcus marmoris TaxID=249408 RepID=A0A1U7NZ58_9DEIO|nr:hypothetical protein [Deinococcus marmoris]OLV18205.1 hypothetical protein BOO71_0006523 [Deinococcus marmoris]
MKGADHLFPLCVPPRHPHLPELTRALELLRAAQVPVPAYILPMGVRTEPSDRGLQGLFDPDALWAGARVMDRARRPALTALHEIGHALDFLVLGEGVEYASVRGGLERPWAAWNAAVGATATVMALRSQRDGTTDTATFAAYLLELPELFARAFAQWVIHVGGTLGERAALNDRDQHINGVLTQQWPEAEFVTLVPHLRALLGLKRSSP